MSFGLSNDIIEKIKNVFLQFEQVEEVIIYGSRAKGNFKPGSDVDITVKGNNLNLQLINRISLKIDDLFLPYTFDISVFTQIENPELLEHIQRVGKVFYKKQAVSKIA
jgi:predicted nucleotidyltransferase